MVQETVSPAAIADEEQGCQENQGTNCARLPFQEEAEQVEAHEHGVAEPQGGVEGLGDEEDGQQPLEAIHDLCRTGPSPRPPGTAAGTDLMGAGGRRRLPTTFFNPRAPGAELLCFLAVSPGSPRQQGSSPVLQCPRTLRGGGGAPKSLSPVTSFAASIHPSKTGLMHPVWRGHITCGIFGL